MKDLNLSQVQSLAPTDKTEKQPQRGPRARFRRREGESLLLTLQGEAGDHGFSVRPVRLRCPCCVPLPAHSPRVGPGLGSAGPRDAFPSQRGLQGRRRQLQPQRRGSVSAPALGQGPGPLRQRARPGAVCHARTARPGQAARPLSVPAAPPGGLPRAPVGRGAPREGTRCGTSSPSLTVRSCRSPRGPRPPPAPQGAPQPAGGGRELAGEGRLRPADPPGSRNSALCGKALGAC